MGVLLMVFAYCQPASAAATAATDDDEMMTRQTRGLVLRSWRNAQQQQTEPQQQQNSADKNPSAKVAAEPILPPPKEAIVFSGLPISMRLVLLQHLAGYDKRTPNSRAFLGMRGKKSSPTLQGDALMEDNQVDDASRLSEGDNISDLYFFGPVPQKKKMNSEKFLGMRGKKMMNGLADGTAIIPNWRERYIYQEPFQKKRAPSSNSFMGMRGKRSESAMSMSDYQFYDDDDNVVDKEQQPDVDFKDSSLHRYQERLKKKSENFTNNRIVTLINRFFFSLGLKIENQK